MVTNKMLSTALFAIAIGLSLGLKAIGIPDLWIVLAVAAVGCTALTIHLFPVKILGLPVGWAGMMGVWTGCTHFHPNLPIACLPLVAGAVICLSFAVIASILADPAPVGD